ncbi:MAG: sporulation protein YqfC [Clostridia bacterium]|nr:sporulation protein YqfC [Clostridia bacterium]
MGRKKLDSMKSTVSDFFELPKDITLNLPRISMVGSNQMLVENHKGVIEYVPQRIRVNSSIGVIRVQGREMELKNIAADDIMITGDISMIEFI